MRIARVARPGALYDEAALSRTSETTEEAIINPIDFDAIADVNLDRTIDAGDYSRIPRKSFRKIRTKYALRIY